MFTYNNMKICFVKNACRVQNGNSPGRVPLPPPATVSSGRNNTRPYSSSSSFQQRTAPYNGYNAEASAPPYSTYDSQVVMHQQSVIYSSINKFTTTSCMTFFFFSYVIMQVCPICLSNPKDMAFGCGHQVDYFSVKSNLFMTLS